MNAPENMTADFRTGRTDLAKWLSDHMQAGWDTDGQPTPVLLEGVPHLRYRFTRVHTPFTS